MTSCFLIANKVDTYPKTVANRYDLDQASQLLASFGVTETFEVRRAESVPSNSGWGLGRDTAQHHEIAFHLPDDFPLNTYYALRAKIEVTLAGGMDRPGIMLTHWHPNAEQVFNVTDKIAGDFALKLQIEDHGLVVQTRNNADVAEGEPGVDDLMIIKALARAVREQLPDITIESASVDEFVGLELPFQHMGSLQLAATAATRAPRPGR